MSKRKVCSESGLSCLTLLPFPSGWKEDSENWKQPAYTQKQKPCRGYQNHLDMLGCLHLNCGMSRNSDPILCNLGVCEGFCYIILACTPLTQWWERFLGSCRVMPRCQGRVLVACLGPWWKIVPLIAVFLFFFSHLFSTFWLSILFLQAFSFCFLSCPMMFSIAVCWKILSFTNL